MYVEIKLQCNIAIMQAREKQLQVQVSSLQQLVANLRADLNKAEKCNEDLQERLTELVILLFQHISITLITLYCLFIHQLINVFAQTDLKHSSVYNEISRTGFKTLKPCY